MQQEAVAAALPLLLKLSKDTVHDAEGWVVCERRPAFFRILRKLSDRTRTFLAS